MSMRSPAPSLGKVEFLVLLWTTFAAFAALYGPQPLLPVIQQHFGVDSQSASLLMTLAILPLGLAPVCYGYILNLCSTRRLLQLTTALCALVLLAASFTTAFWQLLALRTLTGLLVPAILLALMTHISLHSRQESLQRAMAIYNHDHHVRGLPGQDRFRFHHQLAWMAGRLPDICPSAGVCTALPPAFAADQEHTA